MNGTVYSLLTGGAIGFGASLIGGVATYFVYLRWIPADERTMGPLGLISLVNGILVLIGFVAILTSAYMGRLVSALLVGVGVFVGYIGAFAVLLGLWMLIDQFDVS